MFPIDMKRHSTLLCASALVIIKLYVIRVHRGNGMLFTSAHPAEKDLPGIDAKKFFQISRCGLKTNTVEQNISLYYNPLLQEKTFLKLQLKA